MLHGAGIPVVWLWPWPAMPLLTGRHVLCFCFAQLQMGLQWTFWSISFVSKYNETIRPKGICILYFNRFWQIVSTMHVPSSTPTDTVTRVPFSPRPVPSPDFTNQKHFTSIMDKKNHIFFCHLHFPLGELSVHILSPFFCQVACIFFLMSLRGLFVHSGLRKAWALQLDCLCLNPASATY